MSDWSGFATANSLPAEVTERMRMNARLVAHAAQTPSGSIFESFSSRQYGVPMVAESLPGGAAQVNVGTFSKVGPGPRTYLANYAWDTKRIVESQWHQFFGDYVGGRVPVTESLPPYIMPLGPVS